MKYFLFFLFLSGNICRAQTVDFAQFKGESVKADLILPIRNVGFLNYRHHRMYAKLISRDSLKIQKIEDVFFSLMSANTKEWYESHFKQRDIIKKEKIEFEANNLNDTSGNFIELQSKMTIKQAASERTIVKFKRYSRGVPTAAKVWVLTRNNNGWFITNDILGIENYYYILSICKPDVFNNLVSTNESSDEEIEELRKLTRSETEYHNKSLDVTKLIAILKKWEQEKNTAKLKKVSDMYN